MGTGSLCWTPGPGWRQLWTASSWVASSAFPRGVVVPGASQGLSCCAARLNVVCRSAVGLMSFQVSFLVSLLRACCPGGSHPFERKLPACAIRGLKSAGSGRVLLEGPGLGLQLFGRRPFLRSFTRVSFGAGVIMVGLLSMESVFVMIRSYVSHFRFVRCGTAASHRTVAHLCRCFLVRAAGGLRVRRRASPWAFYQGRRAWCVTPLHGGAGGFPSASSSCSPHGRSRIKSGGCFVGDPRP